MIIITNYYSSSSSSSLFRREAGIAHSHAYRNNKKKYTMYIQIKNTNKQ